MLYFIYFFKPNITHYFRYLDACEKIRECACFFNKSKVRKTDDKSPNFDIFKDHIVVPLPKHFWLRSDKNFEISIK